MVSTTPPSTYKNRILAAVPQEDFDRYFAGLQPVSLPLKHLLYRVGDPLDSVYFIEEGVGSVLTSMASGSTIEVGMIGSEGIVGAAALMGGEVSAQQIVGPFAPPRCATSRLSSTSARKPRPATGCTRSSSVAPAGS